MCLFQTPLCIRELGIKECWRNVYCSQYLPKAGVFSPSDMVIFRTHKVEKGFVWYGLFYQCRESILLWDTVDRQSWGARAVRW